MDREEEFFIKRIKDLAQRSRQKGIYTYTNYLTQAEQSLYLSQERQFGDVRGVLFGGVQGCERKILRFGDEESLGYDAGFPICCIAICPAAEKFSEDLTHRDHLGALMNLGIERNTLSDIMIRGQSAYLFCLEKIVDFILDGLTQVKHTYVRCRRLEEMPEAVMPQKEPVRLVVPSMRLDVVIAKMYHLSRSRSMVLFQEKKIFINGRQAENNSAVLREQDVVSVRGFGKFVCEGISGETRKGNQNLLLSRYR